MGGSCRCGVWFVLVLATDRHGETEPFPYRRPESGIDLGNGLSLHASQDVAEEWLRSRE